MLSTFTYTTLWALLSFIFISSITPGPNNIMLLHSGARFGFRLTVPHMLGVSIGFILMIFLCCIGIATVVLRYPATNWALKIIGCAYMLWLSYKLWRNGSIPNPAIDTPSADERSRAQPLTFTQAALFQYVNPKAWMVALTIPAVYLPKTGSLWLNSVLIAALCLLINLPSIWVWARGGEMLQTVLHRPKLAYWINQLIVLMTVYCAVSVWF